MNVKERLLTIRLLEKIPKHAAYAEAIGIKNVQEINKFCELNCASSHKKTFISYFER